MSLLADVINDISKAGYSNVSQHYAVIGTDGLKYCKRCGKPLEVQISHPELGERKYPVMCDCDRRAEQEVRERYVAEEHDRKRKTCFGSFAYGFMDARFANDNGAHPDITRKCSNYCKRFEEILQHNQGLLFYGGIGTGKSYMAACIANELIDRGYSAYMTTLSAIERQTSAYMREERTEFINSLMRYSLLVIDDLGAERQTEYMQELTYEIINGRYVSAKPLIITTNIDIEQIKNPTTSYEKRLFDRVLDACSYPMQFAGKSQRRTNVARKFKTAEELLNEP